MGCAVLVLCFLAGPMAFPAAAQSPGGLVEEYRREYEAVRPRPGSSVGTDYKLDQIAMGALYTVRALAMLQDRIQEHGERIIRNQEVLLERHDRAIRQNEEMVRLLRRLVAIGEGETGME